MSETDPQQPVRIARLVIEGLFGEAGRPIDIEFKLEDRVTVLHGPNGSGKTVTLRLLEALRSGLYSDVCEVPFSRITLESADDVRVEFSPSDSGGGFKLLDVVTIDGDERFLETCYGDRNSEARDLVVDSAPIWEQVRRRIAPVKLVGINRLSSVRHLDVEPALIRMVQSINTEIGGTGSEVVGDELYTRTIAVERIGQDIRAEVERADRQYRELTTQLDATLARRLNDSLLQGKGDAFDPGKLRALYNDIGARERRLVELGLLRTAPANGFAEALDREGASPIFEIVLGDRQKKLEVFKTLAEKAQRIVESLNQKFTGKTIRIDAETGYHVLSASGHPIPLDLLSSGEQHELILMHELLFDIEPGTLLLIDEPELSLHPDWQLRVLPEMLDIARLSQLDIVLATHSPYIANDRHDLMVQVGGRG